MLSLQATRVTTRVMMGGKESAFGDSATNGKAKTQEPQECNGGRYRLRDTRAMERVERDNQTNRALKCISEFQYFVGFKIMAFTHPCMCTCVGVRRQPAVGGSLPLPC